MTTIPTRRRSRWLLGALRVVTGIILHQNVVYAQDAARPGTLVEDRHGIDLGAAASDARVSRDGDDGWMHGETPDSRSLLGAAGVALSDLRPSGFARIDGERMDVVSHGAYIPAGTPVEVIADEGYRRVVRRMAARDTGIRDATVSDVR